MDSEVLRWFCFFPNLIPPSFQIRVSTHSGHSLYGEGPASKYSEGDMFTWIPVVNA